MRISHLEATLVHAFVCNCIDYCNTILAATPKVIRDKLQRVLNAAACVLSAWHQQVRYWSDATSA